LFPFQIDNITRAILFSAALLGIGVMAVILLVLLNEAWPMLKSGKVWSFFIDTDWYPTEGHFGLMAMLLASLLVMTGAILMAFPTGLACAIFICFVAPDLIRKPFRFTIALLAGMPSVVLGLWGLTILVPLISLWQPPGTSMLTAGMVLALMILPTVTLTTVAAFEGLPASLRQSATALGMRSHTQIVKVLIPAARVSIASGLLLAMARALGETMVVLMVAGNVVNFPGSIFEPVRTLTANIALEMAYATDLHRAALFSSGLMLTLLVLLIAYTAAWLQGERHAR
jgi:phosphate transport system permease protein